MPEQITIAVDALGGDHAPSAVIDGAIQFAQSPDAEGVRLLLVGEEGVTRRALADAGYSGNTIHVVPASQVVTMDESPLEAIRRKPDSSIAVCAKLVKSGEAHATVSAGNTGACMVAALTIIERLPRIARAPIASLLPTETGRHCLLVDAGSNVDCQMSHLRDFALLGSIYAEKVMGYDKPRVAMLSNGEEDSKGNELVKKARPLVAALPINYAGNIESSHLFEGGVDVIVSDGFVGNILLKAAEGMGKLALTTLARAAKEATSEADRTAILNVLQYLISQVDYAEYGGAPLLGIDGISLIAHGRSNGRAISSAIRVAVKAARSGYVTAVKTALEGIEA